MLGKFGNRFPHHPHPQPVSVVVGHYIDMRIIKHCLSLMETSYVATVTLSILLFFINHENGKIYLNSYALMYTSSDIGCYCGVVTPWHYSSTGFSGFSNAGSY